MLIVRLRHFHIGIHAVKGGRESVMKAYQSFAQVYDLFMEDIPYDLWVQYIEKILKKYQLQAELMLELGCGTGNLTNRLAALGYDMIGVDYSQDMLGIAKEKAETQNLNVLYLLQDMREFELYGTVDCIISLCDSINYITETEDILTVFRLVNNYLNPKGLFIFDINTVYKYEYILGDQAFTENKEQASYIWENFYDEVEKINEYYINFFMKQEDTNLYERFEETHFQRAYSVETITTLIEQSGMKLLGVYDAFTFDPPMDQSERIYFVVQENGK